MKTIALIISSIAVIGLTACSGAKPGAEASTKTASLSTDSIPNFDISGLQIGMTRSEVETVMANNGYAPRLRSGGITHIYPGLSYEQLLKQKQGEYISRLNRTQHEGIQTMSFEKDEQERLDITFTAFQGGPRVTTVNYSLKDPNMQPKQFQDRVYAKYGEPDNELGGSGETWKGEWNYEIDGVPVKEKLHLTSMGNNNLGLAENTLGLQGSVNTQAYKAMLDAAVPKSEKKTSF